MTIKWDHPAAIELRAQIVKSILEETNIYKGNTMNDNINEVPFNVDPNAPVAVPAVKSAGEGETAPKEAPVEETNAHVM